MRESATMAQAQLPALRRSIAAIEGRPVFLGEDGVGARGFAEPDQTGFRHPDDGDRLPLGIAALDGRLGGGLALSALHEIRVETTRSGGAATGFAVALLALIGARDPRPVLWVEEETALAEAGFPFGPGLAQFGLDPGRLVIVRARRAAEALWAVEEGLRCSGLAATVGVTRGAPHALDLTGSRRLALRAREHRVTGLMVRLASDPEPGAAVTRWLIEPRPSGVMDGFAAGVGRPAFRAVLEKNRHGPTGQFDLEWDHAKACFAPAGAAGAGAGAAVPFDRPDPPAAAGTVVAPYRRTA